MTENQKKNVQQQVTSDSSKEEDTKASQKSTRKKGRLRFKDEDTIKIKYNF